MILCICRLGSIDLGSAIRFLRPVFGRWSLSRAAMHIEQRCGQGFTRESAAPSNWPVKPILPFAVHRN